jgi:hypothetical protein
MARSQAARLARLEDHLERRTGYAGWTSYGVALACANLRRTGADPAELARLERFLEEHPPRGAYFESLIRAAQERAAALGAPGPSR